MIKIFMIDQPQKIYYYKINDAVPAVDPFAGTKPLHFNSIEVTS